MINLRNKNVIITGASGGIGSSIIEKLYDSGSNILASGTRVEKLEEMLAEFMERWGPDTQRKRDERDAKWDEMIRVLTVQQRKSEKKRI